MRLLARVVRHTGVEEASQAFGEAFSHRAFGRKVANVLLDTSIKGEVVTVGAPELKAVEGA